jgi:centrin-2/centrin-1
MIAKPDRDKSYQIEFSEFFEMMTSKPSENATREEVHKVFINFDLQQHGVIALKDLRKIAKDL